MRSIWNGSIAFGLVSIPVKLMSATENHSVSFRQIHTEDGGRVRYRKVCELEDEEVQAADTVRGYEMADGTVVTVTDEDLAALPLRTTKTIEVVAVLPADRIDPLQMDTAYYLAANGTDAGKPYVLLREALKRTGSIALTKFALRGRERLAMLRVVDDVLLLHSLLWPDEIRSTEHVAPEGRVTIKDAELDLADALMDTLGEIDPDTMHDDYRAALDELIAAKLSGELPPRPAPEKTEGAEVIDLAAILEQSVRAAEEKSGKRSGRARTAKKKAAPKKTASKKSASGKKTASGKTAASKAEKKAAPRKRASA
ncbi:Ku protein [Streptomyces uncialis]|uniref:non-homologous end joining protein Ku n=1 Tax=Streptomyces uncialis TaxID=1048205 RepID=UPI00386C25EF|nr:Ku protein [Streptomyces uncialis]